METAIIADPIGEAVDADESLVVDIHVGEKTFAIELQQVTLR